MIKIIIEYSLTGSERRNKTDIQRNQSWLDRIFRFRRHFSSQKYIDLGQRNSRTMHHPCSVSSSKRVYKYIHIDIASKMLVHRIRSWGREREREEVGHPIRGLTWQQKRFSNWSGSGGLSKAIRYRAINASARELNFS